MAIDLVALVRRVVLATSPLLGGCLYCPPDSLPKEPFDMQMMVFEDDSFVLVNSGDPPPDPPDAGTNNGLRGKIMPLDYRMAYDACAADHKKCTQMCDLIGMLLWSTAYKVQTCQVVGGPPERPVLQIAGAGTSAVCGRRPEELRITPASGSTAGGYLAECAALEAASVHAFRVLARELDTCRAPGALAAAARSAARDEIRHAHLMRALARRHGGRARAIRVRPPRPRPLTAIARENVVEGCVRETFGAVVAHVQAATAADPAVRLVMRGIAEDETRHAQLGWAVHAWASSQMTRSERHALLAAREEAIASLRAAPAPSLSPALGLPAPAVAAALLDELSRTIWRAA